MLISLLFIPFVGLPLVLVACRCFSTGGDRQD
jgi:hypothetical protein